MNIKRIDASNADALKLKNDSFPLIGRMIVSRLNGQWSSREALFEVASSMEFPDEDYQLAAVDYAYGAFDDDRCIGLAVFEHHWSAYDYLADLKVSSAYRGHGIGVKLIEAAAAHAAARGKKGIYTIGQDNNLLACRFYLKHGFDIGGYNSHVYQHTNQHEKADIYFYYNFSSYDSSH